MANGRRAFWCGLCCLALALSLSAGCTRHKPERVRAPYRGVPTVEGGATAKAAVSAEASAMAATASAIMAAMATAEPPTATSAPAALASSVTPVPPLNPASETLYEVRAGDTIAAIGERIGVTSSELMERNGITNPQGLAIGQKLIVPLRVMPTLAPAVVVPSATPAPSPTAAPTATLVPTIAPTPTPSVVPYVVQPADTLERVARLYLTTVEAIQRLNPGVDPLRLVIGSTLLVPVPPAQAPRTHTVQAGETMATIASFYGVTIDALMRANNMTNPNLIYAGQKLVIPEG